MRKGGGLSGRFLFRESEEKLWNWLNNQKQNDSRKGGI